jgi:Zinc-binding dehydrogenase
MIISIDLARRLLSELFDLIEKGHITPISPIKIFTFEDIPSAFRYMRAGNHIGKIVISSGENRTIEVPVSWRCSADCQNNTKQQNRCDQQNKNSSFGVTCLTLLLAASKVYVAAWQYIWQNMGQNT